MSHEEPGTVGGKPSVGVLLRCPNPYLQNHGELGTTRSTSALGNWIRHLASTTFDWRTTGPLNLICYERLLRIFFYYQMSTGTVQMLLNAYKCIKYILNIEGTNRRFFSKYQIFTTKCKSNFFFTYQHANAPRFEPYL